MYWTLELASKLEDAPWPATKDELIDFAMSFEVVGLASNLVQDSNPANLPCTSMTVSSATVSLAILRSSWGKTMLMTEAFIRKGNGWNVP